MSAPIEKRHREAASLALGSNDDRYYAGFALGWRELTREMVAQALADQEAEIAGAAERRAVVLVDLAADTLRTGDSRAASIAGQGLGVCEFAMILRDGTWKGSE